jgi:type VI secretion system protein ImpL
MSIYWGSLVSLLFFMGVGWLTTNIFHFEGQAAQFIFLMMGTLGLTSSAFFYFRHNKWNATREAARAAAQAAAQAAGVELPPTSEEGAAEIDSIIREADSRLAKSASTPGATLASHPVIFLIGDRGSAKTSTVLASGVEPELLSGTVYTEQNQVAPTRTANIWYARGLGIVEAGGQVLGDPANWTRLLKKLQPGQLKSIVGTGGQSPRGVVLCFDIENFARPDAAEAIAKAARYLQARLGDISQELGISFPVYVLFTRCDRLPFFADYVRNLTMEEAGQMVGVTLPMRPASAGVYGEEETRRLTESFNNLFYSLCDKRLLYLPRETEVDKVPGAYEFPREFRKLRQSLVQFLVEIGRPSQLRASPFLRGFYFSGVRPIVLSDSPVVAPAPKEQKSSLQEAGGATRMFRIGMEQEIRQKQMQAGASAGGRKVPQWLFLSHLFTDVLFADRAAMGASGSSVKTSLWQRILLGALAGLALLYAGLLTWSYFGNRALENRAIEAARNMPNAVVDTKAIAAEDDLKRLETLRQSLLELTRYEKDGAPLRLRFGLYAGSAMYPEVRRIYYDKFRQQLFGGVQGGLLAFLRGVPAAPGPNDDFGYGYDSLKAYLLTTSEYKRSSDKSLAQFLANTLLARWAQGREDQIGKPRLELAKLQFDFYAQDLANGNPYADQGEGAAIERARAYLWGFGGIQTFYRALLAEAAKKGGPGVSFNTKFPGTAEAVTSTHRVEYAFTREGYDFIKQQMKNKDLSGEQWVMGPPRGAAPSRAELEKGVWDLYTKDYIETWRSVIKTSSVNRYQNLQDAAKKLQILTSMQSQAPLLCLMWWSSWNTAIDLPGVAPAFASVQKVVPPQQQMMCIVSENTAYNNSLMKLQSSVDQASQSSPPDPNVAAATLVDANSARTATQMLGNTFPIDQEVHLEKTVGDLLVQPITYAESLLKGLGAGQLNAAGAGFCNAFEPMRRKFPFNPEAQDEVTLDELGQILRPKESRVWKLYEDVLKKHLTCSPTGDCTPTNADPLIKLNPAFVTFFSQMMKFSRAMYTEQGQGPNFRYTLSPRKADNVEAFEIKVNGDATTFRGNNSKAYVWPGPGAPSFQLTIKIPGGSGLDAQTFQGPWSVFRFFAEADRALGGNTFEWRQRSGRQVTIVQGKPLIYEITIDAGGAPVVFSKEFLSTLKCVSNVAR